MLAQGVDDGASSSGTHGGDYAILQGWNPDVSPDDHVALFRRGCTRNGLQCLKVRRIVNYETTSPDTMRFSVELTAPDGGLFVRGPCCAATSGGDPPDSVFVYEVRLTEEGYKVTGMPPYVP